MDSPLRTATGVNRESGGVRHLDSLGIELYALTYGMKKHHFRNPQVMDRLTWEVWLRRGVIFKSLEDGDSPWSGGTFGSVIRALVVDPQSPSTLYAFDDNSAEPFFAGYLDKSTDGGATWTRMPVPPLMKGGLAIDPSAPSVLYADADGPFQTRGVFKTTNGGMSWTFTGLAKRNARDNDGR